MGNPVNGGSPGGLRQVGPGRFALVGRVGFGNAGDILAASTRLFANERQIEVDLGEVSEVDSAALALLLEWLSVGRREGRTVRYARIPAKLHSLARLSGVEDMLAEVAAA